MKVCVDVCSGLEGFSQAFKDSPEWSVITIDIDRKFKPTVQADVRYLPLRKDLQPDVLLMSPPCERFSVACHTWPKTGIAEAMWMVGACLEAVAYLKPKFWLLENPMGRLRWFLGKPSQTVRLCDYGTEYQKKTDLWGNIILPMIEAQKMPTLYLRPPNANARASHSALVWMKKHGKAQRSKMPLALSEAILNSIGDATK